MRLARRRFGGSGSARLVCLFLGTTACVGTQGERTHDDAPGGGEVIVAGEEARAGPDRPGAPQGDTGAFAGRQMSPFNPEVMWIWHPIRNDPREVIITHWNVSDPPPPNTAPNIWVQPPLSGSELLYLEWVPDPQNPNQDTTFGDGDPSKQSNQQLFLEWAMARSNDDNPVASDFDVQLYGDGSSFAPGPGAAAPGAARLAPGLVQAGNTILIREGGKGKHPNHAVAWIWRPKSPENREVWLHLLNKGGDYKGKYELPGENYSYAVFEFTRMGDADPKWDITKDGIDKFKDHVIANTHPKNPKIKDKKHLEVHDYEFKLWK